MANQNQDKCDHGDGKNECCCELHAEIIINRSSEIIIEKSRRHCNCEVSEFQKNESSYKAYTKKCKNIEDSTFETIINKEDSYKSEHVYPPNCSDFEEHRCDLVAESNAPEENKIDVYKVINKELKNRIKDVTEETVNPVTKNSSEVNVLHVEREDPSQLNGKSKSRSLDDKKLKKYLKDEENSELKLQNTSVKKETASTKGKSATIEQNKISTIKPNSEEIEENPKSDSYENEEQTYKRRRVRDTINRLNKLSESVQETPQYENKFKRKNPPEFKFKSDIPAWSYLNLENENVIPIDIDNEQTQTKSVIVSKKESEAQLETEKIHDHEETRTTGDNVTESLEPPEILKVEEERTGNVPGSTLHSESGTSVSDINNAEEIVKSDEVLIETPTNSIQRTKSSSKKKKSKEKKGKNNKKSSLHLDEDKRPGEKMDRQNRENEIIKGADELIKPEISSSEIKASSSEPPLESDIPPKNMVKSLIQLMEKRQRELSEDRNRSRDPSLEPKERARKNTRDSLKDKHDDVIEKKNQREKQNDVQKKNNVQQDNGNVVDNTIQDSDLSNIENHENKNTSGDIKGNNVSTLKKKFFTSETDEKDKIHTSSLQNSSSRDESVQMKNSAMVEDGKSDAEISSNNISLGDTQDEQYEGDNSNNSPNIKLKTVSQTVNTVIHSQKEMDEKNNQVEIVDDLNAPKLSRSVSTHEISNTDKENVQDQEPIPENETIVVTSEEKSLKPNDYVEYIIEICKDPLNLQATPNNVFDAAFRNSNEKAEMIQDVELKKSLEELGDVTILDEDIIVEEKEPGKQSSPSTSSKEPVPIHPKTDTDEKEGRKTMPIDPLKQNTSGSEKVLPHEEIKTSSVLNEKTVDVKNSKMVKESYSENFNTEKTTITSIVSGIDENIKKESSELIQECSIKSSLNDQEIIKVEKQYENKVKSESHSDGVRENKSIENGEPEENNEYSSTKQDESKSKDTLEKIKIERKIEHSSEGTEMIEKCLYQSYEIKSSNVNSGQTDSCSKEDQKEIVIPTTQEDIRDPNNILFEKEAKNELDSNSKSNESSIKEMDNVLSAVNVAHVIYNDMKTEPIDLKEPEKHHINSPSQNDREETLGSSDREEFDDTVIIESKETLSDHEIGKSESDITYGSVRRKRSEENIINFDESEKDKPGIHSDHLMEKETIILNDSKEDNTPDNPKEAHSEQLAKSESTERSLSTPELMENERDSNSETENASGESKSEKLTDISVEGTKELDIKSNITKEQKDSSETIEKVEKPNEECTEDNIESPMRDEDIDRKIDGDDDEMNDNAREIHITSEDHVNSTNISDINETPGKDEEVKENHSEVKELPDENEEDSNENVRKHELDRSVCPEFQDDPINDEKDRNTSSEDKKDPIKPTRSVQSAVKNNSTKDDSDSSISSEDKEDSKLDEKDSNITSEDKEDSRKDDTENDIISEGNEGPEKHEPDMIIHPEDSKKSGEDNKPDSSTSSEVELDSVNDSSLENIDPKKGGPDSSPEAKKDSDKDKPGSHLEDFDHKKDDSDSSLVDIDHPKYKPVSSTITEVIKKSSRSKRESSPGDIDPGKDEPDSSINSEVKEQSGGRDESDSSSTLEVKEKDENDSGFSPTAETHAKGRNKSLEIEEIQREEEDGRSTSSSIKENISHDEENVSNVKENDEKDKIIRPGVKEVVEEDKKDKPTSSEVKEVVEGGKEDEIISPGVEEVAEEDKITSPGVKKVVEEGKEDEITSPGVKEVVEEGKEDEITSPGVKEVVEEGKEDEIASSEIEEGKEEDKEDKITSPEVKEVVEEDKEDEITSREVEEVVEEDKEDKITSPGVKEVVEEDKVTSPGNKKVVEEDEEDKVTSPGTNKGVEEDKKDKITSPGVNKVVEEDKKDKITSPGVNESVEQGKEDKITGPEVGKDGKGEINNSEEKRNSTKENEEYMEVVSISEKSEGENSISNVKSDFVHDETYDIISSVVKTVPEKDDHISSEEKKVSTKSEDDEILSSEVKKSHVKSEENNNSRSETPEAPGDDEMNEVPSQYKEGEVSSSEFKEDPGTDDKVVTPGDATNISLDVEEDPEKNRESEIISSRSALSKEEPEVEDDPGEDEKTHIHSEEKPNLSEADSTRKENSRENLEDKEIKSDLEEALFKSKKESSIDESNIEGQPKTDIQTEETVNTTHESQTNLNKKEGAVVFDENQDTKIEINKSAQIAEIIKTPNSSDERSHNDGADMNDSKLEKFTDKDQNISETIEIDEKETLESEDGEFESNEDILKSGAADIRKLAKREIIDTTHIAVEENAVVENDLETIKQSPFKTDEQHEAQVEEIVDSEKNSYTNPHSIDTTNEEKETSDEMKINNHKSPSENLINNSVPLMNPMNRPSSLNIKRSISNTSEKESIGTTEATKENDENNSKSNSNSISDSAINDNKGKNERENSKDILNDRSKSGSPNDENQSNEFTSSENKYDGVNDFISRERLFDVHADSTTESPDSPESKAHPNIRMSPNSNNELKDSPESIARETNKSTDNSSFKDSSNMFKMLNEITHSLGGDDVIEPKATETNENSNFKGVSNLVKNVEVITHSLPEQGERNTAHIEETDIRINENTSHFKDVSNNVKNIEAISYSLRDQEQIKEIKNEFRETTTNSNFKELSTKIKNVEIFTHSQKEENLREGFDFKMEESSNNPTFKEVSEKIKTTEEITRVLKEHIETKEYSTAEKGSLSKEEASSQESTNNLETKPESILSTNEEIITRSLEEEIDHSNIKKNERIELQEDVETLEDDPKGNLPKKESHRENGIKRSNSEGFVDKNDVFDSSSQHTKNIKNFVEQSSRDSSDAKNVEETKESISIEKSWDAEKDEMKVDISHTFDESPTQNIHVVTQDEDCPNISVQIKISYNTPEEKGSLDQKFTLNNSENVSDPGSPESPRQYVKEKKSENKQHPMQNQNDALSVPKTEITCVKKSSYTCIEENFENDNSEMSKNVLTKKTNIINDQNLLRNKDSKVTEVMKKIESFDSFDDPKSEYNLGKLTLKKHTMREIKSFEYQEIFDDSKENLHKFQKRRAGRKKYNKKTMKNTGNDNSSEDSKQTDSDTSSIEHELIITEPPSKENKDGATWRLQGVPIASNVYSSKCRSVFPRSNYYDAAEVCVKRLAEEKMNNESYQMNLNTYQDINIKNKNKPIHKIKNKTRSCCNKVLVDPEEKKCVACSYVEDNRPLFVTTVKKGMFLEPPPEIAAMLGLSSKENTPENKRNMVYSFSSKPRPCQHKRDNLKCELYQGNESTRREHRKSRGPSTSHQHPPQHNPDIIGMEAQGFRFTEAKRRTMTRSRVQASQYRHLRTHIDSPPPLTGRKHEIVQTLQTGDILEEITDNPSTRSLSIQTDPSFDSIPSTSTSRKAGNTSDCEVQTDDVFDYTYDVQPVLDVILSSAYRDALMEVLHEDDQMLAARKERIFKEARNQNEDRDYDRS